MDPDQEEIVASKSFEDIIRTNGHLILPSNHSFHLRIEKIVNNLSRNINSFIPDSKFSFQVFVIENNEPNAFVLPGGQIFVNTGIISFAQNDDALATVLSHEVLFNNCICKSQRFFRLLIN